jgi:hypothetical protein
MPLPSSFLVSLVLAAQAGGTPPAAKPAPAPTFIITTGQDPATLSMAADNQDPAIVTVLDAVTDEPLENGRLNDRKNGNYTGLERATLAPSKSFKIVLSAFRDVAACSLVLASMDRQATFTLSATAATPDVTVKGVRGAEILKLAEDGKSLQVKGLGSR